MTVVLDPAAPSRRLTGLARLLPGVALSAAIGAVAYGLQIVETRLFEHPWIEGLVLAILIGAGLRLAWTPSSLWTPGISFSAKTLLEVAVALLGATVSGAAVAALGPWLLLAIVGVVAAAIVGGYALGRAFGLPHAMALLVACGNAICGNSAIAAVAPVIEAEGEDVAAAIGFTAVLGVAVVLLVPVVGAMMGYDATRVGVLAGLTVYAVPQVLAAAAPAGLAAVQTGAVVKLVRVLMLGPVCLVLGLMRSKQSEAGRGPRLHQMAPWFILVFLALMTVRSLGWLPEAVLPPLQVSVSALTLIAMAALGLMVDPRAVVRAGPRVAAVAALSALLIGLLALAVIAFLPLG
ncbi:putative sulfate exporter family transporter [Brevundimonas diminuta]|uniref:YeiH family protein n=1 Tax=Brevundimonas TaxID=41275 RepID=UPI0022AF9239|nr:MULTISPECIES: putative sulfate exporter family transporter [Brevundimonas]MCZ4106730.1 putative sulfate exporter family transporter [Brevundimonas diminuta]